LIFSFKQNSSLIRKIVSVSLQILTAAWWKKWYFTVYLFHAWG